MRLQTTPDSGASSVHRDSPPAELVAWSLERFANQRMVITTSFGMEGCALIDMYASHNRPMTAVYLDTMFFFPETYELLERMVARYPHIDFVNRGTSVTPEQQEARYGPEPWKHQADLCCKLRKVDPMRKVLANADVWITALRRTQSSVRANLRAVEWDWKFQLIKICPLANSDRQQVWEYVKENDVPYNTLHERGYPTIGCTHCTVPVPGSKIGQYNRSGRWAGSEKTECGLHGDGI